MGKPTGTSAIVILPSKSVSPVNLSSAMHSGMAECHWLHDGVVLPVDWVIQEFYRPTKSASQPPCAHQNPIANTHHSLGKSSLKLLKRRQSAIHKQNEWRMAHGTQCCNNNHPCFEGIPVTVVCFSLIFGWGGQVNRHPQVIVKQTLARCTAIFHLIYMINLS